MTQTHTIPQLVLKIHVFQSVCTRLHVAELRWETIFIQVLLGSSY